MRNTSRWLTSSHFGVMARGSTAMFAAQLTEARLWQRGRKPWSRRGSTGWLWTARSVERAIDYVINCQGDELPNYDEWDSEDD